MAVAARRRFSEEEYLALERAAEYRSEFFNGEIFAMAGATRGHNVIALNIASALHAQLRGRPCEAYTSDMRVKVEATGLNTYPDVVVVCGERRFTTPEQQTLLNPTLVVEVLSESTEAYDRGDKFGHYRLLPSLREYVLVSQNRPRIERFLRHEGDAKWDFEEVSGMEATLRLASIDCELALADLYERIEFESEPPLRHDSPGGT